MALSINFGKIKKLDLFKIRLSKLISFLKKLTNSLGEHFFLSFLVIAFFILIFGVFLFYKYIFLVEKIEPEVSEKPLFFKEEIYQKVLEEWRAREKRFEETEAKKYPNPFQAQAPIPPVEGLTE